MRVNRHKKAQRILSFYTNNFGFRPPFQLVLDGTFCQVALKQQFHIREQVPKYLGEEVKFLTTPCVLNEVETLGEFQMKVDRL
jgi:U3 small nucleolar RNA-associated protein 23